MRGGNNHVHDFWQTHRLRGEIPVVELKKKMTGKFLNSSVIILAEIFSEIVVEKIPHPKNVSQTQWLIHIYHVSTLSWLLVLTKFHSLTCLST